MSARARVAASAEKTARNAKLGVLHMLKLKQGLSDDLYRDKLEQITGQRSAADCSDAQLDQAIAAFHVKQNGNKPYTAHAKALWIALYNLGGMADGSDAALDAFVLRQSGKARLSFLTPADSSAVTEALKGMCARHGFAAPAGDKGGMDARRALLEAQWKKLGELGEAKIATPDGLAGFVIRKYLSCHASTLNMTREQLDDCARNFGNWIRKAQRARPEDAR